MTNVYGNSGNRWWVGENVGETGGNQTVFGTPSIAALNPFTPSGYESLPSGNAADDAQFAAAAVKNKGSKSPVTISVENIEWFNIQGPYATQAQANAAIPSISAANPSPGILGQSGIDNANNPLGVLSDLGAALQSTILGGFKAGLSGISGKTLLIRGAKIVVGSVILILGLAKLTGFDHGIVSKAVKAAPLL